jgi:hypothetical protein
MAKAGETGLRLAKVTVAGDGLDLAAEHGPDCAVNEVVHWLADIQSASIRARFRKPALVSKTVCA